jgi:uncharacterized protein with HEPN domain
MDNVKNDAYYIKRLKQDLEFVVTHMKNVDIEELNANEVLLDSMLFRMIQISENAKNCQMNINSTEETFHGMQSMD